MNELSIIDQAARELPSAMAALEAGDADIAGYARSIRQQLEGVTSKSREATARAAALRADDVMNPEGRARQLAEIPGNLTAATMDPLAKVDELLELIERFHEAAIIKHDHRDDANLRAELGNYV